MKLNEKCLTPKELLIKQIVGEAKIEIFIEKLESPCTFIDRQEFIFKINDSTSKSLNFPIQELLHIYTIIQKSMVDYVQNEVIPKLDTRHIQLMIEAEGGTNKETQKKDKLYNYQLDRLSESYTDLDRGIYCTHTRDGNHHYLNFSNISGGFPLNSSSG